MTKSHLSRVLMLAAMVMAVCDAVRAQDAQSQMPEPVLSIAGVTIEGVFEPDKPGPYRAFYDDLMAISPVKTALTIVSTKRLTRDFFNRTTECYYLATDDETFYREHGHERTDFYFSRAFNRIYLRAYTLKGQPVLADWASLEGKVMVGDEGLHLSTIAQRKLPFAKSILYAKTVDDAFDVVANGRAQVVLAYSIDAEQHFEHVGKTDFHADDRFYLLTLGEGFTCWPSETARRFIDHASETIAALNRSGELKHKYGFSQ